MAKLPILMYHKVDAQKSAGLTISATKLEEQFDFLIQNGYQSHHLSDLQSNTTLSGKNVVITFDDGYVNQLTYAIPLLEKYHLKATFFIPLQYVGDQDRWNETPEPIMDREMLNGLPSDTIELAYHSYAHGKYDVFSQAEIIEDTKKSFQVVDEMDLPFHKSLAYPYGKFPRVKAAKSHFFQYLKHEGFHYGLRIGNRVNSFPFSNPYEINRIDVKGEWELSKFKRKLKYGKWF